MTSLKKRATEKQAHSEIEKILTKRKYACLFPGCRQVAIGSHSQQKNGSLRAIAENGKIMRLDDSLLRSYNHVEDKLKLSFALRGIGESTIFPGFCTEHERLFDIFEQFPLQQGNIKQALALHYRTIAYEYARQRREIERWQLFQDYILDTRGFTAWNKTFTLLGKKEDHLIKNIKPSLDLFGEYYKSNATARMETLWLKTDCNIGMSCSSCINLHLDEYVNFSASNPGVPIPFFTLNAIPSTDVTNIVISWNYDFSKYAQWIFGVISADHSCNELLNRLLICDSEDSCINPTLWNAMPNKDAVISSMSHVLVRGRLMPWQVAKFIPKETPWTKAHIYS